MDITVKDNKVCFIETDKVYSFILKKNNLCLFATTRTKVYNHQKNITDTELILDAFERINCLELKNYPFDNQHIYVTDQSNQITKYLKREKQLIIRVLGETIVKTKYAFYKAHLTNKIKIKDELKPFLRRLFQDIDQDIQNEEMIALDILAYKYAK